MGPLQYRRVISCLKVVADVLKKLLYLVPMLDRLLRLWRSGSRNKDLGLQKAKTEQVNVRKDKTNE